MNDDDDARRNRALGAFLGAAIGDAAGSHLEFRSAWSISAADVDEAMTLPGGGPHRLAPGQITDDTELAIALARGLLESKDVDDLDPLAAEYVNWFSSRPFDVGSTCINAFSTGGLARAMSESTERTVHSKSNGALMRTAPLACLPPALARAYARRDAQLSHRNPTCQTANEAYAAAISTLVRANDPRDAIDAALTAVRTSDLPAEDDLERWMLTDVADDDSVSTHQGFVKHGFSLAFHHLRHETSFARAIEDVLRRGGDTDTNAAIVGCMLGARCGADALPADMKEKVLTCRPNHDRPAEFRASCIPRLVDDLLAKFL